MASEPIPPLIEVSALTIPIIALVIANVTDGVKQEDPTWYRGGVMVLSVIALVLTLRVGVAVILVPSQLLDLLDYLFLAAADTLLLAGCVVIWNLRDPDSRLVTWSTISLGIIIGALLMFIF